MNFTDLSKSARLISNDNGVDTVVAYAVDTHTSFILDLVVIKASVSVACNFYEIYPPVKETCKLVADALLKSYNASLMSNALNVTCDGEHTMNDVTYQMADLFASYGEVIDSLLESTPKSDTVVALEDAFNLSGSKADPAWWELTRSGMARRGEVTMLMEWMNEHSDHPTATLDGSEITVDTLFDTINFSDMDLITATITNGHVSLSVDRRY